MGRKSHGGSAVHGSAIQYCVSFCRFLAPQLTQPVVESSRLITNNSQLRKSRLNAYDGQALICLLLCMGSHMCAWCHCIPLWPWNRPPARCETPTSGTGSSSDAVRCNRANSVRGMFPDPEPHPHAHQPQRTPKQYRPPHRLAPQPPSPKWRIAPRHRSRWPNQPRPQASIGSRTHSSPPKSSQTPSRPFPSH